MLGSTAVAKQLLREIADKLIADQTPPEALFKSANVRADGLLSRASEFISFHLISLLRLSSKEMNWRESSGPICQGCLIPSCQKLFSCVIGITAAGALTAREELWNHKDLHL